MAPPGGPTREVSISASAKKEKLIVVVRSHFIVVDPETPPCKSVGI